MARPLPKPPSTVLFDLDGTLIDTAPDFIRCLNRLRQEHKLEPLPAEGIRPHVSDGARAMIRLALAWNLRTGLPGPPRPLPGPV